MTKNKKISLIAVGIILGVYNLTVFVLPFEKRENFWVGYSFSMVAILLTAVVVFYAFRKGDKKSKFFGWPLSLVAWSYLVLQTVAGFAEMILTMVQFGYGLVLNTILLGGCVVGLIGTEMGTDEVARIDEEVLGKVFYIRSLQTDVEALISKSADEPTKKMLKNLAETIRYSDPMSNPALSAIENKIAAGIIELENSINDMGEAEKHCNQLQQLLTQRNQKCKILK